MRRWRNRLPTPLASSGALLVAAIALACCVRTSGTQPASPSNATSPRNTVLARAHNQGLVEVASVDPRIRSHLRYTTARNASGQILYPQGMPTLLRLSTAKKLAKAQTYLHDHGLGILIWDAYRPPEVQQALWDLSGRKQDFVSDPSLGWSAHCTGTAIDLTLVDLAGRPLAMPTDFDVLSQQASALYTGEDLQIRRRMRILHKAMRYAGLSPYIREWWHFSDPDFQPLGPAHVIFASSLGIRITPPQSPASPSTLPAR